MENHDFLDLVFPLQLELTQDFILSFDNADNNSSLIEAFHTRYRRDALRCASHAANIVSQHIINAIEAHTVEERREVEV